MKWLISILLTSCNHFAHVRLLPCSILLMNNVQFSGMIYGLVCLWKDLLCLRFLSLFRKISNLTHHSLHVRFDRKPSCTTEWVLLGTLDGRLDNWHKSQERVGEGLLSVKLKNEK